jgi:hypothetical protein
MRKCRIKGIINSESDEDRFTDLLLCDFCIQADAKRIDDAQIVSCADIDSVEHVICEVCSKTASEERLEIGFCIKS